jgi:hypothetical protein
MRPGMPIAISYRRTIRTILAQAFLQIIPQVQPRRLQAITSTQGDTEGLGTALRCELKRDERPQ